MARRRNALPSSHHERWVVSYADFITLLLAFFVVMYSISSVNEGKYRVLSESLQGIFRGIEHTFDPIEVGDVEESQNKRDIGLLGQKPAIEASRNTELPPDLSAETEELQQIELDAKKRFQELIADGELSISGNRLWVEIEIQSGLLFPSGSATLDIAADGVLEAVAEILKTHQNPIHVEGFTDDRPVEHGLFPSNWELSAARAAGVVRTLAHFGVAPERLAAVGFGQYQPKVSNRTPRGRAKNRRVKIIVSRDERVRRSLTSYGSEQVSEDAVQAILQEKAQPGEAPAGVKRVETENGGVLFTAGDQQ